ncbi:hypothetical protein QBC47DRAFT_355730 [Echria macrotheca]|uniref:Uncharacterized protein n=1 Tax=Echria macrotheca TaxID=438768 RepID=A0AAJ0FG33_9PEZI|nr:hypothetical protein QBC47DRAFT_355730 [Echria macrotheca]
MTIARTELNATRRTFGPPAETAGGANRPCPDFGAKWGHAIGAKTLGWGQPSPAQPVMTERTDPARDLLLMLTPNPVINFLLSWKRRRRQRDTAGSSAATEAARLMIAILLVSQMTACAENWLAGWEEKAFSRGQPLGERHKTFLGDGRRCVAEAAAAALFGVGVGAAKPFEANDPGANHRVNSLAASDHRHGPVELEKNKRAEASRLPVVSFASCPCEDAVTTRSCVLSLGHLPRDARHVGSLLSPGEVCCVTEASLQIGRRPHDP